MKQFGISPIIATGGALVLVFGGVAAAALYSGWFRTTETQPVAVSSPTPSATTTASPSPSPSATAVAVQPTWLSTAVAIRDLKLIDPKCDYTPTYFKVGTITEDSQSKDVIRININTNAMSPDFSLVAVGNTSLGYTFRFSDESEKKSALSGCESLLQTNKSVTTTFASIQKPEIITQDDVTLNRVDFVADRILESVTLTDWKTSPYGKLSIFKYSADSSDSANTKPRLTGILLTSPSGERTVYEMSRPSWIRDDGSIAATTSAGSKINELYRLDGGGACGKPYGALSIKNLPTGWTAYGTSSTGETLYRPSNPESDALFTERYLSSPVYTLNEEGTGDASQQALTTSEIIARAPMLMYANSLGEYTLLVNARVGILAECGKPVVYLYPTETQQVSVDVDAAFSRTIPTPNREKGWKVTATPEGAITAADGTVYDYLYWAGMGSGRYPLITSGFIVPRDELETTLRTHLQAQGLNNKEASQFMEYWLPRMPKTPFTRLTWFGTKQMNTLAPMTISPTPDTVLRVFLDFEGVTAPYSLRPQNLKSIERKGFTVVEWGGLLRNNSR